jgi:hypothetical protein
MNSDPYQGGDDQKRHGVDHTPSRCVTTSECLAAPVVVATTEQMVEALKAARRFSDLYDVSDEDHGFVRPGDRLAFYAVS